MEKYRHFSYMAINIEQHFKIHSSKVNIFFSLSFIEFHSPSRRSLNLLFESINRKWIMGNAQHGCNLSRYISNPHGPSIF